MIDDIIKFIRQRFQPTRAPSTQNRGTGIRYVPNEDGKGWLIVLYENGTTIPPLPYYLKVRVDKVEGGRDYFTILEGENKGKRASVSHKNSQSRLLPGTLAHSAQGTVKFNRPEGKLWFGSQGPITAKTQKENPVPIGTHALEIPYEAHGLGHHYQKKDNVNYATTWFRIGHSGDRFLHPGTVSAGCVTVTELKSWDSLYKYLIKARVNDGLSVGTIEVTDEATEQE